MVKMIFLFFVVSIYQLTPCFLSAQEWTIDSSRWIELKASDGWNIDMKYATEDNFVEHQVYECARCFLRPDAAEAVAKINQEMKKRGLELKFFDCYRPLEVQWELWEEVPNPNYVANPRKGSMHNRGQAIDVTLIDAETGKELEMGTGFDFFGREAHHSYTTNLPDTIQKNRTILKTTMERYGFMSIRTEWWHYSLREKTWPIFEEKWGCNSK